MRLKKYEFDTLNAAKEVVIRQGAITVFHSLQNPVVRIWVAYNLGRLFMAPENPQRPPWLNWLFLLAFLWSSYQLGSLWFARLHG